VVVAVDHRCREWIGYWPGAMRARTC
jgi:hypothetical protein